MYRTFVQGQIFCTAISEKNGVAFLFLPTSERSLSLSLNTTKILSLESYGFGFPLDSISKPSSELYYVLGDTNQTNTHKLSLSLSLSPSLSLAAASIDQVGLGNQVTAATIAAALHKSNLSLFWLGKEIVFRIIHYRV
jgi:hypothetical protein